MIILEALLSVGIKEEREVAFEEGEKREEKEKENNVNGGGMNWVRKQQINKNDIWAEDSTLPFLVSFTYHQIPFAI